MIIKIVTGCTKFRTTIDGENIADVPERVLNETFEDVIEGLKRLFLTSPTRYAAELLIKDLVCNLPEIGDYSEDYICETCDDHVETRTWEI